MGSAGAGAGAGLMMNSVFGTRARLLYSLLARARGTSVGLSTRVWCIIRARQTKKFIRDMYVCCAVEGLCETTCHERMVEDGRKKRAPRPDRMKSQSLRGRGSSHGGSMGGGDVRIESLSYREPLRARRPVGE